MKMRELSHAAFIEFRLPGLTAYGYQLMGILASELHV